MISKACLVGAYQTKLEELGAFSDVELHVIVPPYWRQDGSRLKLERAYTDNYALHVTPMALNGRFHLHFYPRLRRHMRRLQPDILHIDEEPYNLATWQAMRLAKRRHCQALFFTWQNIQRAYPFPFDRLEQYNLGHADYALAGNAEAVDVLRAKGYQGPTDIIPQFGVDPDIFGPQSRQKSEGRPMFVIGYMGRLVPEKGLDLLLGAVSALDPPWRLEIIGQGPEMDKLALLAQGLGIADRMDIHPWVPSGDVPARLNQFDVLALPSKSLPNWKEQFGRVLIEAMSCQVPVVGSDSGEIPHVIGNAGLVFPEGDIAALRDRLQQLQQNEELRRRLGRLGRERVLTRYTQAQIAAQTRHVYKQMCGA
jgi:glycosyltransferase involved in cell wall biosynthesis